MPLYDTKCQSCGTIKERWGTFATVDEGFSCECGGHAVWLPSFGRSADAQSFAPVVIHRDAEGNIRYPGQADAPVPEGFQKVELTSLHAIRAFEKEVNDRDAAQAQEFHYKQKLFREGQIAENRRALEAIKNGGAWKGLDENGKEITLHGMTERGRRFYDAMRAVSDHKNAHGHSPVSPAFFVEAFSQNASNREDHRDASSNWERKRK